MWRHWHDGLCHKICTRFCCDCNCNCYSWFMYSSLFFLHGNVAFDMRVTYFLNDDILPDLSRLIYQSSTPVLTFSIDVVFIICIINQWVVVWFISARGPSCIECTVFLSWSTRRIVFLIQCQSVICLLSLINDIVLISISNCYRCKWLHGGRCCLPDVWHRQLVLVPVPRLPRNRTTWILR